MKGTFAKTLLAASVAALSASALAAPQTLTVWRHETGDNEMRASAEAIQRFNASQDNWKVVVEKLPEGSYTESITAAALAGDLPCIFDMDQPTVPNFAWSGYVRPLSQLIDKDVLASINDGGKGTYKGEIYSVGQFDVAIALFTRHSTLEKYNLRKPTLDKPWTQAEFDEAIAKIKASGEFMYPLDINTVWTGEWSPYGFGPFLQSFGGDLINRDNYTEAEGVLNGESAVAWGEWFQNLVQAELIDRKPADDKGFINKRVAMHYTGSWSAGQYMSEIGDDLAILPVPDFGNGPVIGGGSWQWGISTACKTPEGAAEFLTFLMQPEEVAAFADTASLLPTTAEGAKLSKLFNPESELRVFYDMSSRFTKMRPATPGYPVISSSFDKAVRDIADGVDPQDALDVAVDAIEQNIEDNKGYGFY